MTYHKAIISGLAILAMTSFQLTGCFERVVSTDDGNGGVVQQDGSQGGNNGQGGEQGGDENGDENQNNDTGLPPGYEQFTSDVEVYKDGDYIVIKSNGIPNHGSPYFDQSHLLYEDYNGTNPQFHLNPNRISEQNLTFRLPVNPTEDPSHPSTPMGPIGVSVNGVPFYNQYAAGGSPLTGEINSFDHYNGHPQQMGGYHYHIEPLFLTTGLGKDALLGFLLDGFPVYGPEEDGKVITNSDLDDYHGHFGATKEYPEGIYHYHITAEDPYLNGAGFYGKRGALSQ